MRIGELSVLPAARTMKLGDVLAAPGTSCRHQVHDGAGVRALHPVEVVAGAVV
jgi:Fe-S oxidoreductase